MLVAKSIHFVGVGGVSMSALIRLARDMGAQVSGSDSRFSPTLAKLLEEGYDVYAGCRPEMARSADLVVYTGAVPPTNPELQAASRLMERSEFLGEIARGFEIVIGVAGTHGKTTSAAYLASILEAARLPFTAHIGGEVVGYGSGYRRTGDRILVTEACEYREHFLALRPTVGIVTNVEYDHPDYYRTPDQLYRAFGRYAESAEALVCPTEVSECIGADMHRCLYDDMCIRPVPEGGDAWVYMDRCSSIQVCLPTWGAFNAYDACLAIRAARVIGVDEEAIKLGVASFSGVKRRQQVLGRLHGAPLITDYAHHPTEIRALLEEARKRFGRLCVVFQPHTYSRTEGLMAEFATCFEEADTLYILPTYAARETGDEQVVVNLERAIKKADKHLVGPEQLVEILKKPCGKYNAYLLVGAGDVNDLAQMLPLGD